MTVLSLAPFTVAHHTILVRVVRQVEQVIAQVLITGYVYRAVPDCFIFVNRLSFFQLSSLPKQRLFGVFGCKGK